MIVIGTPYTKGAGYFLNDKDLQSRQEADIQTCAHCQAIIKMQEWKEEGAWCGKEQKPICARCGKIAETYGCVPFNKKLEEHIARTERLLKAWGLDKPATSTQIFTGKP